jgi:radical SAM superfamily enzyme YgiQ (UPF0313 family)
LNILLINPGESATTEYISKVAESNHVLPLGLLYIASFGEEWLPNIKFHVLDMLTDATDLEKLVADLNPMVVGITVTTLTLKNAYFIAQRVKKISPKAHTVMGGPHCGIYPQETIALPCIDSIVTGEGEIAFVKLVNSLLNYGTAQPIYNGSNSIKRLDILPFPARHLVDIKKYRYALSSKKLSTTMITSRGCPFHCTFCYRPPGAWRARSAKDITQEIHECLNMGIEEFEFYDDTFTYNKQRTIDICLEIKRKKLKLSFGIRTRVDCIDEEMLSNLKAAGCKRINFGIESPHANVLKILGKQTTGDLNDKMLKLAHKIGIETQAYLMIGSPGESVAQMKQTIQYAKKINPDYAYFSITSPMPGTPLYQMGLKQGLYNDYWKDLAIDPTLPIYSRPWPETDINVLKKLNTKAYRSFYWRLSYIFKKLLKIRSFGELWTNSRIALGILNQ